MERFVGLLLPCEFRLLTSLKGSDQKPLGIEYERNDVDGHLTITAIEMDSPASSSPLVSFCQTLMCADRVQVKESLRIVRINGTPVEVFVFLDLHRPFAHFVSLGKDVEGDLIGPSLLEVEDLSDGDSSHVS
jgi:hypothetical protein